MKIKSLLTLCAGIALMGSVNANATPEMEAAKTAVQDGSCGIVTLYDKPPKTKDIYYAAINSIDNQTVNSGTKSFALAPGSHRIRIIENITDNYFTRRRGEMLNYKYINLNVEAGKKYALGAEFVRKNRSKLKTGEYWNPVVWKTSEAECKL